MNVYILELKKYLDSVVISEKEENMVYYTTNLMNVENLKELVLKNTHRDNLKTIELEILSKSFIIEYMLINKIRELFNKEFNLEFANRPEITNLVYTFYYQAQTYIDRDTDKITRITIKRNMINIKNFLEELYNFRFITKTEFNYIIEEYNKSWSIINCEGE